MSLEFITPQSFVLNDGAAKRSDLSAAQIAAIQSDQIKTAHLFRASFKNTENGADEFYTITDYFRNLVAENAEFVALGEFLSFSGLQETTDSKITVVNCTLSGIESTFIAALLQYHYIDRALEIWRVFLDNTTDQVIGDPIKIFSGRIDEPVINEDPTTQTCNITLSASSHFVDFLRRPGRHTNNDEQQSYFLGDRGFEFVGNLDKNLTWGR